MTALTNRERQIAALLASGKSQGEAAILLGLSIHTVRSYLKSARAKTGSVTSTQLACRYVKARAESR